MTRAALQEVKISFHRRFIYLILLLFLSTLITCTNRRNKHHPTSYFPVQAGNTWIFDGDISKMEITAITDGTLGRVVSMSFYDSTDVFLWLEKYIHLKDQLYFESFEPQTIILPKVLFDPALPLAPFSSKPGHKISLEGKETHVDSVRSEMQILVTYEIEAIEDVIVPAGEFHNCIKMKINVEYTQFALRPFFIGEQYWWYAPMVGPVKYDLPSAYGELAEVKLNKSRIVPSP
jgi:hypothetical protein